MNRKLRFGLAAVVFTVALGYAEKVQMRPAPIVPAATGELETNKDDNGNTEVKIKVKNLAKPERLTPAKSSYIVWTEPAGGAPKKEGQLRVNDDLEGEFRTVTALTDFGVVITAEDGPTVTEPSGPEVFRANVR